MKGYDQMKRKTVAMIIAFVLSISTAVSGFGDMAVQANTLPKSNEISTEKLKIKNFKWKAKQILYMGQRVYTVELTNKSKFDVLGFQIRYRLKEDATDEQKALFDEFKQENSEDLDQGEVTMGGALQRYVKSGSKLTKVPLTLGLGDYSTATFPTKEQFEAMEEDYIALGIIYKNELNVVYYDCINKSWSVNGSKEINNWPENDITSLIVKPKSKVIECDYLESINHFNAFRMAVDDELISRNPFDFPISDIMMNNAVKRDALTNDEQKRFLKFVKEDSHFSKFYEGFYILIHTGMRISEFCGLTYKDVDYKRMTITISKQLQYHGANNYWIEKCKTNSGLRTIPIPKNDIELMRCFKTLCSQAKMRKNQPEVDGVKGFLYLSEAGKPLVAFQWAKKFEYAVLHHNRIYKKELPKITPHICRHTYCSNMIKAGVNPKVVQYLMGHSSS